MGALKAGHGASRAGARALRSPRLPLVLVAAFGVAARADDAVQRFRSDDRMFSIELPAAWTVTVQSPDATQPLRLEAVLPGTDGDVVVSVWLLQGQRDPTLQAYVDREDRKKDPKTLSATVETSPRPQLVRRYLADDGAERVEALAYSMVRRNGIAVQFRCPAGSWPALRETFLRVAGSLQADVVEWPPHPPEFRREQKDGFVYLVHPSVKAAQVKDLQSLVHRVEGTFEALHGKIPMPEENPPLIVVLGSIEQGQKLHDMKSASYGTDISALEGRLFVTPLPGKNGPERAACAMKAFQLMHVQRYGSQRPYWMYSGEARLVWSEESTGAKLPTVDTYLFKDVSRPPAPFVQLVEQEGATSVDDSFRASAAAHVLFFREGPAKYRKAYQQFKADFATNHDLALALDKHLLSLDQPTLKEDLERWLKRSVESVEGK